MVEWKKLGEICDIKGRIGFRGYTREDQVEKGQGAISLSPGNITDDTLVYDSCTYITWEKYNESPEIMVNEGDIILCKTASVGKVARIKKLPEKATINPQLVVLKNISINPQYIFYVFTDYPFQTKIKGLAGVGSVPNVSQAKLSQILIPVPSLEEQNRIVGILDTFTDSIENLKQQIAQRRKQYKHFLLKILKGFDTEVLEYLADFRYGYTANSSEDGFFRIIRITDIDASGRLLYNDKKYIIDDNKCRDYILNKGDLVVARTGASFGKTLYFQDDEPSVFASFLIQIIPNNKKLDNKYYWHFSRSPIYWNQANALVSKGGQQQFNTGAIKKIKVPLPPLSEQQRIVSILDTFEASISNLEAQLAQRQKQYEYYRNQLLTFE